MSTTGRLDRVLAQLEGAQQKGQSYEAHCPGPSHRRGDHQRSLSVTPMPDGGIRLKCFTGCTHEQIVAAAGIDRADLRGDGSQHIGNFRHVTPRPRPAPKPPKPAPPRRVRKLGEAAWPVRDAAGVLIATKRREDWRLADGTTDKARWWEPTLKSLGLAVEDVPLFGSENLISLPKGSTVAIVEGEKACAALLDAGVAAVGTTTGAATIPSPAVLSVLAGYDVTLWPDNDTAGHDHMTAIAGALGALDIAARWFDWRDAPEKGDAADYLQATAGDGCALPILRALLRNAPSWAPALNLAYIVSEVEPGEVARKAALLDEIERFLHSQRDMTAAEKLATIDAGIGLNARERLGDRDDFYLPDAGIAARTGIDRDIVARTRAKWEQYAHVTSHKAPPPADLVGKVKDYDGNHIALPAGHAPAGARLIASCRINIPAKPPHKAKGVPRRVALRDVLPLPETVELCDACPPETPLRVQIVCTGCGQVGYDQQHVCADTGQTMPQFSALLKIDRETLSSQETVPKITAWFESAHRRAARQHALATLEPAIPPREGLMIPYVDADKTRNLRDFTEPPEKEGMEISIPSAAESLDGSVKALSPATCAICGVSPAPHRTGHRPPLQVCRSCLLSPIPMDDTGRALIVGGTYSAEHKGNGDNCHHYQGGLAAAGGND